LLLAACVAGSSGDGQAKTVSSSRGPRLDAVTFFIQHRVFHDFRDLQRVEPNQDFILGDTEYSARVVQYLPNFQMDLATRKAVSLTDQPINPAFRIVIRKGKVPQDTTWAFLNAPPHFSRKSYFAFQVLRIDFTDHAPLLADTTATTAAFPPHPAGAGTQPPAAAPTPHAADSSFGVPAVPAVKDSASLR
jgi:hypothetical protein